MYSHRAVRLEQRPGRWTVPRRLRPAAVLQLHQLPEARQQIPASKNTADVANHDGFPRTKQLLPHGNRKHGQLLRGVRQNIPRHRIAFRRCPVHQLRKRSHARPGPFIRVQAVHRLVCVRSAGGLKQHAAERGLRAPAFLESQRRAHRLAHNVESASFVAEQISPAAGTRRLTRGIPAEGDRASAGDRHDTRLSGGRAGKRNERIVRHDQFPGRQNRGENGLLVGRSAAHAEACGLEMYLAQIELSLLARRSHAFTHRPRQLVAALSRPHMIARPADANAQHAARLVADERLGARLAAIHS